MEHFTPYFKRDIKDIPPARTDLLDMVGDRKLIVLGPFTGGYGHFFCQYLTALAGIREANPDAYIIASAAHVFAHYCLRFADAFYGFKHNWAHIKPAASVSDGLKVNPDLTRFLDYVERDFRSPDTLLNTLRDNDACHNLYIGQFGSAMPMLREKPYNPDSNLIIVWGRMKKGADWRNGNAKQWRETIRHLQGRGFDIAVAGARGSSMFFEDMDNIRDLTDFDDVKRGAIINEALQEARCALVDMSGTMCECYLVGCPLLTYNADPRHIVVIPRRNIFGVREDFMVPKPWPHWQKNPMVDGDMSFMPDWLVAVDKFVDGCATEPPFKREVSTSRGVFKPF